MCLFVAKQDWIVGDVFVECLNGFLECLKKFFEGVCGRVLRKFS